MVLSERDHNLLRPLWTERDDAGIGRTIFEAIQSQARPNLAGSIVTCVTTGHPVIPELSHVIEISKEEMRWKEAHEAFQCVRQLNLKESKRWAPDQLIQSMLDVGETAAKVIYSASGQPAPFDYHSGWRMAQRLKRLSEIIGDREFEDYCWKTLISMQQ